ncbi:hypothetical protein LUD75_09295 [Epilithonimonas sp. JDS]|uniref:hypothetical protein n=1 Tax=Epilithonimonas sp. JDS TaxID=2902797 RepID=UPI001E2F5D77|nr:hypothetical protein [Epilithonimonas sp. JDS]MCD9854899.1 hypothetical protein [Epilithonimonas sp. JDS]
MTLEKLYKYQLLLYFFIILFGIQNYYLNRYNFEWIFYESIVTYVFFLFVMTVFCSLIFLTVCSIKTINRKKDAHQEIKYLLVNLILYYLVIGASLYLSTQIRL